MKKYLITTLSALLFSTMTFAEKPTYNFTYTSKFIFEFSPSIFSPVKKCVYSVSKHANGQWFRSFTKMETVSKKMECPKSPTLN